MPIICCILSLISIRIVPLSVSVAREFWHDKRIRTPILIIWVASFGGALHTSVTTYYYLEVGATDVDIGVLGFIMSCGSLLLSPLFGWMLDARGPFEPIFLTAGACSLGCLIRGTATSTRGLQFGALFLGMGVNLWVVVLAHIANCTDRKHRSAVISGFSVQETMLRLTGKGLFPLWDLFVYNVLHVKNTLPRYRVHMAICTLFCIFGWLALLVERFSWCSSPSNITLSTSPVEKVTDKEIKVSDKKQGHSHSPVPHATLSLKDRKEDSCSMTYVILVFALLAQSFASTVVLVLWPLFLRDRYNFTASEFGVAIFITSLSTTLSIASFPKIERKFGPSCTASICAIIATFSCLAGFVLLPIGVNEKLDGMKELTGRQVEAGPLALREFEGIHLFIALCLQTSLLTLEPSLKSVFSLHVPPHVQGRSIGLMATIGGMGGMGGNLIGTYLYQVSKQDSAPSRLFGAFSDHGRLPFSVVTILLGLATVLIIYEGYQAKVTVDSEGVEKESLLHMDKEERSDSPCCLGEKEEDIPDNQIGVAPSIGSLLNMETSYTLKLD